MNRRAWIAAGLACGLLAGCAAERRPTDPDVQLAQLLRYYEKAEDRSSYGEHADEHAAHITDRGRLRVELERLSLEFPEHPDTLLACALTAIDAHEYPKAQRYLDRLLRIVPGHARAGVLRSQIALREGNVTLATKTLEAVAHRSPDAVEVREALAGVYYTQGRLDAAEAELRVATELGAPQWRVRFNEALIAEAREDWPTARALYAEAHELAPDYGPAEARLRWLEAERVR